MKNNMLKLKNAFLKKEAGATAVEYGLIAGLIAVAIVVALQVVGGNLTGIFNKIAAALG